ncbi:tetratricopeptide repeat protein [Corallococcus sp. AB032C]|uniref:tetratricopeptide repeat protein n=1 Tax=Corallococcus sp. AB032C TaxID=2316717 RepID=UPI000EBE5647|nr:tetratricopeptide repeat protein [Corallococcus sp. AB032C]RKH81983.1 tetratricopeptide repeat protein [Corallococcus sp. AB032C]
MSTQPMRRRAARAMAVGLAGLLALPGPAWAVGPLEKDHPLVQRGRDAYAAGRYEDALRDFDAAKKERPNDPTVEFNRADALAKLGRSAEAREAFKQVAESSRQPELTQKSWYNLGNLAATAGDRSEALKSYRKALTLDPTDPQARHNYEVVLRDLPPPQNGPDGGTDGGQDEGEGDSRDGGADGGSEGEEETESNPRDGGSSPGDVDRQEAERLLDAMKQNEKNLQLWRFQQKKKQRKPNEKDW